jgi:hypothetical protein
MEREDGFELVRLTPRGRRLPLLLFLGERVGVRALHLDSHEVAQRAFVLQESRGRSVLHEVIDPGREPHERLETPLCALRDELALGVDVSGDAAGEPTDHCYLTELGRKNRSVTSAPLLPTAPALPRLPNHESQAGYAQLTTSSGGVPRPARVSMISGHHLRIDGLDDCDWRLRISRPLTQGATQYVLAPISYCPQPARAFNLLLDFVLLRDLFPEAVYIAAVNKVRPHVVESRRNR